MRPKPSVSWNPESVSLVLTADSRARCRPGGQAVTLETRLAKLEMTSTVYDRAIIWTDRGPAGESLEHAIVRKFGHAIPEDLVVIVMRDNGRDRLET